MGLFNVFDLTHDIAIDLGTANTLIVYKDQVVVDEPSIVAIDRVTNKVIAVGRRAMQMHEKTHENIRTIRPLKDGVIADFEAAENMIRKMIELLYGGRKHWFTPSYKMIICIPSGITEVEKKAVFNSAEAAGAIVSSETTRGRGAFRKPAKVDREDGWRYRKRLCGHK